MNEKFICPDCSGEFIARYAKSCGNCFACTGCEIYVCPFCDKEIIIKPIKKTGNEIFKFSNHQIIKLIPHFLINLKTIPDY
jgi:hypothetical protein